MTTTTMTSLVTRRFDDEWRLLTVVSPFPAVRVDFLLAAAAVLCVVPADVDAEVDGALRFLSRWSIMPYKTQTRLSGIA